MATVFRWFFVCLVLAFSVIGCANDDRRLSLLDSQQVPRVLTDEQRRLQSLQLVRYTDANGNEYFMPTQGLDSSLSDYCNTLALCPSVGSSETCVYGVCTYGRAPLCAIRHLQSAALLRAEPLKLPKSYRLKASPVSDDLEFLGNYDEVVEDVYVPPQSPAARAAILRYAVAKTMAILRGALPTGPSGFVSGGLTDFTNCPNTSSVNNATGDHELPWSQGNYAAGLWAEVTVQAYDLLKELSEDATDAILAAADAQRSISTTTAQAAARSFSGEQLSRAEAAHLLIGGSPGLLGETTKAFCSSPELSGRARAALGILRFTAPDPDVVISPMVDLTVFLDGIRARLEVLDGQAIPSLADYTGFSFEDFAQARSYLAQEIQTFGRDRSVTFVPEAINPIPSGMSFFAATAHEPVPPPPEYFAALARRWDDAGPRRPPDGEFQATDVSASLAVAMARIREAVGLVNGQPYIAGLPASALEAKKQFQGPLNLLAARDERVAQLGWRRVPGGNTRFYVDGHNAGHKLRIVRGLSGLLCATTGKVEGVPCSSATLDNSLTAARLTNTAEAFGANPQVVGRGYDQAAWGDDGQPVAMGQPVVLDWSDATPIFLIKPKDPVYEVPGGYDVLAGLQLRGLTEAEGANSIYYRFAIYPELEKKAGEILRPSTKWCTRAAVECDGTLFDERLPLENELSDDQDGVESSWRHYLSMAEQAASEAHALGEQYILNGLEVDRNLESIQLREAADRQRYLSRVEGEMETLQDICGTAMDTSDMFALLGGAAEGPADGLRCGQPSDCCSVPGGTCPYTCTNGQCIANACGRVGDPPCPSPYTCVAQRCVLSPGLKIQDEPTPTEGISRLRQCIGKDTVLDYVALGSTELCLWDNGPANPTEICQGASEEYPCPVPARRLPAGSFDCVGRAPPSTTAKQVTNTLGIVDTSDVLVAHGSVDPDWDPCDQLRKTRGSGPFVGSDNLSRDALTALAFAGSEIPNLSMKVELPSVGGANTVSINADGRALWKTATGGTEWPCGAFFPQGPNRPALDCGKYPDSLFCQVAAPGCSQQTASQRDAANDLHGRLFAAMLVLHGLGFGDFDRVEVPVGNVSRAALGAALTTRSSGPYLERQFSNNVWAIIDDPADSLVAPPIWGGSMTPSSAVPPADSTEALVRYPLPRQDYATPLDTSALVASLLGRVGAPPVADWAAALKVARPLPNARDILGENATVPWPETNYTDSTLHDAYELLCEATRGSAWFYEPIECPDYSLPSEVGENDLLAMRRYADCRAKVLRRSVGSVVLARVPERVVEGLRTFAVTGASPLVGGQMGSAMDRVRAALIRFSNFTRTMSDLAAQADDAIDEISNAARQVQIQSQNDDLALQGQVSERTITSLRGAQQRIKLDQVELQQQIVMAKATMDCATTMAYAAASSVTNFGAGLGAGGIACSSGFMQAGLEVRSLKYEERIQRIEIEVNAIMEREANNNVRIAENNTVLTQLRYARELIVHRAKLRTAFSGMESLTTEAQAALEEIRASLTDIESLRLRVQRSIMRAMQFETTQAAVTENIESVLDAKLNVSKKRYIQAHKNAIRYAFLAKRAIEQRLGMHLSELRTDMPLVEAPSSWEADVCSADGVDYDAVRATAADAEKTPAAPVDFSSMYIGDYVGKLKNVVESYRLQYDFHEGTDEAVASLRDDVFNMRASCAIPSSNLLLHSARLDHLVPPGETGGWEVQGCAIVEGEGASDACLRVKEASQSNIPGAPGFILTWGAEATAETRLIQRASLKAGLHRLSWFTDAGQGLVEAKLLALDGSPLLPVTYENADQWEQFSSISGQWPRQYRLYELPSDQEVLVALSPDGVAGASGNSVGGLMLEALLDSEIGGNPVLQIPAPFAATTDRLAVMQPLCEDKDGRVFRRKAWKYGCTKLCTDGFSDNCLDSSLADRCYWETTFSLDLRDLESGRIFAQSGFARGNFNYRIEDVGVNFVGTELRDCSQSPLPSTCNAAGFVTYSLQHLGPLFVRNHTGGDFPVKLFDGNIEHARGLGLERYLTNPLSSTDRELMTPYLRGELKGRPLDGNFVLRVWDENGVNFDAIEDVQLYLKYRYWTRFN